MVNIKKLKGGIVEIIGDIAYEEILKQENEAIKNIGENLDIPGFRKGHVPKDVLKKTVGDLAVLEESAHILLPKIYLETIKENKIDAIGRPEIVITKMAIGSPVEFKITTSVIPEITLPDYKKIAEEINKDSKEEKVHITDEDLEKTILEIKKMRTGTPAPSADGVNEIHSHVHDENCEHDKTGGASKDGAPHDFAKSDETFSRTSTLEQGKEAALPELTDEFVKQLGKFESVADFKEKLRENMRLEKENKNKKIKRIKIIEGIAEKSEIDLPEVLVEGELEKMTQRLHADIEMAGFKFEDYLKQIKKDIKTVREEWRPDAMKRARVGLVLDEVAKKEGVKLDETEVSVQSEKIISSYKEADPVRVKAYVESMLTNEKIFELLENL